MIVESMSRRLALTSVSMLHVVIMCSWCQCGEPQPPDGYGRSEYLDSAHDSDSQARDRDSVPRDWDSQTSDRDSVPRDWDSQTRDRDSVARDWESPFGSSLYPPVDHKPCYSVRQVLDTKEGCRSDIPLPKLATQFETKIEAKILQKGYTVEVDECYDYPNNRGVVTRRTSGHVSTWIYDSRNRHSFIITGSSCRLSDAKFESSHLLNFSSTQRGDHIGSVADLFNFGAQYNETYVSGNKTVRGIPVDHWVTCIDWDQISFTLDYYFSRPGYISATGQEHIPVRAVLRGQAMKEEGTETFHHIYDFLFYRPGPIADSSVFQIPRGTVCEYTEGNKSRPLLPDSFTMAVEMIQPQNQVVNTRKYYYDYSLKLSRYDLRPDEASMQSWGQKYGYRPINLIHDYNTGTQYVIDVVSRNCSVSPITMDTVDADPRMTDPGHVIMRHGRELFDLDTLNLSFQGQKVFRAMDCDVWAAVRPDWPQQGTNTSVELYFVPENWTLTRDSVRGRHRVMVGLWLTLEDSTDGYVSEWISHIYDYRPGDPPISVFDVGDCYNRENTHTVTFSILSDYSSLVEGGISDVLEQIHIQLLHLGNVQALSISRLQIEDPGHRQTTVQFRLLDSGDEGFHDSALYRAFWDILNTSSTRLLLPSVQGPQNFTIVSGSLKLKDSDKREVVSAVDRRPAHMYSSGSMAGLAIMMLLIGFVTGAGVVFYHKVKKLPLDIPYSVQD